MSKLNVAIFMGGKSGEHEVSLVSAKSVLNALDKNRFAPILIGISKKGNWYHIQNIDGFLSYKNTREFLVEKEGIEIFATIHNKKIFPLSSPLSPHPLSIDACFPVLHGTFGEDGTIQGMFEMLDIPYVGPNTLASSVCMDKDLTKTALRENNILVADHIILRKGEKVSDEDVKNKIGYPCFIKPANMGSSVGITKVKKEDELKKAIDEAFLYDNKILIEKAIIGREIECSVLGLDKLFASCPGEIIPTHEFYSYDAKYLDENGAKLIIPAKLNPQIENKIKEIAIASCKALEVEIMARVDFFLEKDTDKIYISELNTIPGFTSISMYPKLLEASGIKYSDLITKLIELATARHERNKRLKRTY